MQRKLAAILCADVYGYSRLMGDDEEATLRTLSAYRAKIDSLIEQHHGRFVNSAGDSVLAEFASVTDAVNCAVSIQTVLKAENNELPSQQQMEFRIGINLGDVIAEGEQIYGDGVNVAARLESLAEPGGICISGTVHDQVRYRLPLVYEDIGEQMVKNIAHPVHVWRVKLDGATPSPQERPRIGWKLRRSGTLSMAGIAIAIATFVIVQHVSLKPPHTSASAPPPLPLPMSNNGGGDKTALPMPSIPSIAVLPFTNLSGDPGQEYFSDGLTDNLITSLSRLPGVFVISRNSTFFYKGKAITVQQAGRELGVRTILQGSVLRAGNRVRINAELADSTSGANLWAQGFDRPLTDIFTMQDDIVRKIVTTLSLLFKVRNLPHPGPLHPTDSLEAFDDMLEGAAYAWRFTKETNSKARKLFEKAADLDPKYADAYGLISVTYINAVAFGWSDDPPTDLKRGLEFAHKALALDDSNLAALNQLSWDDLLEGRFDQAVTDAERAVALNPNYPWSYDSLARALILDGKPEQAVPNIQKAIRLDPASEALYVSDLGHADLFMGHYPEAAQIFERHLATFPNNLWGHFYLSIAYSELGREQDARAQAAAVIRLNPQFEFVPFVKVVPNLNQTIRHWYRLDLLEETLPVYSERSRASREPKGRARHWSGGLRLCSDMVRPSATE